MDQINSTSIIEQNNLNPASIDQTQETRNFFKKVYAWMCLGLAVSGLTAFITANNHQATKLILSNQFIFFGLLIAELILVWNLIKWIERITAKLAGLMFIIYSLLTGLTLSVIFLVFTYSSIGMVFFIAAGMFGLMSIYGYLTKNDLTNWGPLLFMSLIGIILASVFNLFLRNGLVDYVISIIGVITFTGLTAYDTQKIKKANIIGNEGTDQDQKEAIIGALNLYLDFINLFLKLLRLFGKRR